MNIDSGFGGGGGGGKSKKKYNKKKKNTRGGKSHNTQQQSNSFGSSSPFGGNTGSPFGGGGGSQRGGGGGGGGNLTISAVVSRLVVNPTTRQPELQVLIGKTRRFSFIGGVTNRGPEEPLVHLQNEVMKTLTSQDASHVGVPPVVLVGSTVFKTQTVNAFLVRSGQGWDTWAPVATDQRRQESSSMSVNGKPAAMTGSMLWCSYTDLLEECRYQFAESTANRNKCCNQGTNCTRNNCTRVHMDFNRYTQRQSGGGGGAFGGFGGGGGGGGSKLDLHYSAVEWFVRHGDAFLKKYQEKIELMNKQQLYRFFQACVKRECVLHEDDELQVSIRTQFEFPQAPMQLAYLNKTSGQMHFAVELKVASQNMQGALEGQVPPTLAPNAPTMQVLRFMAKNWFGSAEIPAVVVQHALTYQNTPVNIRKIEIKVPFILSGFLKPAPASPDVWAKMAQTEKKRELQIPNERMAGIDALLTAMGMTASMQAACVMGSGFIHSPDHQCYVVIEFAGGKYSVSVRSTVTQLVDVLVNFFSFLEFCSAAELLN